MTRTRDQVAYTCPSWCTASHPRTGTYDPYALGGVPLHTGEVGEHVGELAGLEVGLAWSDADPGAPIVTVAGLEVEADQALTLSVLLEQAARLAAGEA